MLLNEFLKEHHKVESLEATVTELKTKAVEEKNLHVVVQQQAQQIESLAAALKTQAEQIETVTEKLRTKAPTPQLVSKGK